MGPRFARASPMWTALPVAGHRVDSRVMRTMSLFVIGIGLAACGDATSRTALAPSTLPAQVAVLLGEEPSRPANRARLAGFEGTFVEIWVEGEGERAESMCELIAENERRQGARASELMRVERPCNIAPLPPVMLAIGTPLLISERPAGGAEMILEQAARGGPELDANITTIHVMTDVAECEALRNQLMAANARARAETEEAVRAWLAGQRLYAEQEAARVCATRDDIASRCATERSRLERALCAVEQERSERECRNARALIEDITQREPNADPDPEPRCVIAGS